MRTTAFTAILQYALLQYKNYSKQSTVLQEQKQVQEPISPATSDSAPPSPAEQAPSKASPSQPGVMFWTDGKAKSMPFYLRAVAMVTLLLFVSWIWIIAFMLLAAPFSKIAATLAVALWATLMLPCQVSIITSICPLACGIHTQVASSSCLLSVQQHALVLH